MIECRNCSRCFASAHTVRVCDGHDYCLDCLERKAPALAENLRGLESFTIIDDYYSPRTIALKMAFFFAMITPLFTMMLLCAGLELAADGEATILEVIIVPPLLSIAVNALTYAFCVAGGLELVQNPRSTLTIADGAVSYSMHNETWMAGRWEDFSFRVYSWNGDPRLPLRTPILYLIHRRGGFLRRKTSTIALSQGMYNRWNALLALTAHGTAAKRSHLRR